MAEVAYQRDELAAALATLAEALRLGATEGYLRVFVDEGRPMATLVGKLLAGRHQTRPTVDDAVPLDYLSRLVAGQTNQEIAQELVVTVETVKSHVGHLLDKLGWPTAPRRWPAPASWACCPDPWVTATLGGPPHDLRVPQDPPPVPPFERCPTPLGFLPCWQVTRDAGGTEWTT